MTLYNVCNKYTNYADTVLTIGDYVAVKPVKKTWDFTKTCASAFASAREMGIKDCVKTSVKWMSGLNNLSDAVYALPRKPDIKTVTTYTTQKNGQSKVTYETEIESDERSIRDRIAESLTHIGTGVLKVGTLSLGNLYVVGTMSNALDCEGIGKLHCGAKMLGSVVTNVGTTAGSWGGYLLSNGARLGYSAAETLVTSPNLLKGTMVAAGVSTGLYIASKGFVNAANGKNCREVLSNTAKCAAGIALVCASVAAPFLLPGGDKDLLNGQKELTPVQ